MSETIKLKCRICLNQTYNPINIYETKLINTELYIVAFLKQLTNLEILENDDLTKVICQLCLEKLNNAYSLIQECLASDKILRDLVKFPKESNKYQCDQCELEFTTELKRSRHKNQAHNDHREFKCTECLETFLNKNDLETHSKSHQKFVCKLCHKQFAYAYLLKQHEFKHSDEKPFPCTKCDKGCLTAESLRRHMKVHDTNYTKKKHSCKICSKEFAYPSFLAEHMKNHTGEKPHLCSICGKGFRQSGALHFHQRVHTGYRPFTCTVCNGNFMSQSILKLHMRKHTNERPYVCHICGMAFRQSRDLKSHHRTHSGEKPVLCTICGKRMFTTGQLTIHIRSHTGEKPFICSHCPKAFTTKTMLVKHERIHTGERPYLCDICGRAFNQSSTLKTHRKRHNNKTKTKNCKKPLDNNIKISEKNSNNALEIEIVTEEFISDNPSEIDGDKKEVKQEYSVVELSAPIPLLHQL